MTRDEVTRCIRDNCTKPDAIRDDATFVDDLGMDSLDMVELVMQLEEESGRIIHDEVAEGWRNVGDVYAWAAEGR